MLLPLLCVMSAYLYGPQLPLAADVTQATPEPDDPEPDDPEPDDPPEPDVPPVELLDGEAPPLAHEEPVPEGVELGVAGEDGEAEGEEDLAADGEDEAEALAEDDPAPDGTVPVVAVPAPVPARSADEPEAPDTTAGPQPARAITASTPAE